MPSDDAIRAFRARNASIKLRKSENTTATLLEADHFTHVNILVEALKQVEKKHPEILQNPHRIWNMDETAVEAEYGRCVKVFSCSESRCGGRGRKLKESETHLIAVLCSSASVRFGPLFCIAQEKSCMESWLKRFSEYMFTYQDGTRHWLTRSDWIQNETIVTGKNMVQ